MTSSFDVSAFALQKLFSGSAQFPNETRAEFSGVLGESRARWGRKLVPLDISRIESIILNELYGAVSNQSQLKSEATNE